MSLTMGRRRWLLVLVGVVFSLYLLLLLTNAYRSQTQLRAAADSRLIAGAQQTAILVSESLADRQSFARGLAEIHEIETFLTNRALGMSMRYGLNANLAAIEESFRQKLAQERLFGMPVYERILYLAEDGSRLVDTDPDRPIEADVATTGPQSGLRIDREGHRVFAAASVDYRGQPGGVVVTVSSLGLLSRYLAASSLDSGFRQLLIDASGQPLIAGPDLGDVSPEAFAQTTPNLVTVFGDLEPPASLGLGEGPQVMLRSPVAGTSLSVLTLAPSSLLYGHITSRRFLYSASFAPLILFGLAVWIGRMRERAQRLEADVMQSNRDRAQLQDRNDALTAEIARRQALEHRLRESEERYRTYVEHAPEGIFVWDRDGRLVDVNPSACAMVGRTRGELIGMTVTDLSPPGLVGEHLSALEQALRNGGHEVELPLCRRDGEDLIASLRAIALPSELVMEFCVDVTERKQAEAQIHKLAYFDPLTGLPNRRLLLDRLAQAIARSGRTREYCALMVLDLDHFKDLNDTQGHDVGDRLLAEVARRLTRQLRPDDTVARLGGDEYVIVAGQLGQDESAAALRAEQIAERAHRALGRPYALSNGRAAHHSSASIGVALFCGRDLSVDVPLKQADVALYQAKSAGRNAIRFFNPDMQAAIDERAALEHALRRALGQDELRLFFQPQVDHQGRVTGAEVLLRWMPPGGDPISPARFIPLAEDTGLIIPIGAWVLEKACAQLSLWQADPETRRLTLSVNVSARQFLQTDFVTQVSDNIRRFGIDPRRLKLELTESVVLDRVDQVIGRMQTLKALGVGFSLDDFGTGYSSLSYLKRLPLDQVKIDQSFVRGIPYDQNDVAIVRAVLAISDSLGLSVVAEGVETQEQRAFLLRYGCGHFQGYLFGRPGPVEELQTGCIALEGAASFEPPATSLLKPAGASIISSPGLRPQGGQAQRSPLTPARDSVDFALARPPYWSN